MLARVAINNIFYARIAIQIMLLLVNRFKKEPPLHQFLGRIFRICLQMIEDQELSQRALEKQQKKAILTKKKEVNNF